VEMNKIVVLKLLILREAVLAVSRFQRVRLWKKCLLLRVLESTKVDLTLGRNA
jgi:hypothetical protein